MTSLRTSGGSPYHSRPSNLGCALDRTCHWRIGLEDENIWASNDLTVRSQKGMRDVKLIIIDRQDCRRSDGIGREIAWLQAFGKPRLPFDHVHRDITNYQPSNPNGHMQSLSTYLKVASPLVPNEEWLRKPIIRHSDLTLNNILVSDDLQIVSLVDPSANFRMDRTSQFCLPTDCAAASARAGMLNSSRCSLRRCCSLYLMIWHIH